VSQNSGAFYAPAIVEFLFYAYGLHGDKVVDCNRSLNNALIYIDKSSNDNELKAILGNIFEDFDINC
jgi:hypothetical protein